MVILEVEHGVLQQVVGQEPGRVTTTTNNNRLTNEKTTTYITLLAYDWVWAGMVNLIFLYLNYEYRE